jgi:hypothetical protein
MRRGYVVTAELGFSRAIAAALVLAKEAPDLIYGMSRCLSRLGALPATPAWDREGRDPRRRRPADRRVRRLLAASCASGG